LIADEVTVYTKEKRIEKRQTEVENEIVHDTGYQTSSINIIVPSTSFPNSYFVSTSSSPFSKATCCK